MLEKNSQIANRFGLNTKVYAYKDGTVNAEPVMVIDFANLSEIALEGDSVWATGGQARSNKIGFNNPIGGTFKLTTQIVTSEVLALLAGKNVAEASNTTVFENTADGTVPVYYTITSETVWQDETGTKISEDLIFHKAKVKRGLNISYDGGSDPVEVSIEFELADDASGKVLTITRADIETPEEE